METSDQGTRPYSQAVPGSLGTDINSNVNEAPAFHANRTADDSETINSNGGDLMPVVSDVVPPLASTPTGPGAVPTPLPSHSDSRPDHAVGDSAGTTELPRQVPAPVVSVIAETSKHASENGGLSDKSTSLPSRSIERGVESTLQSGDQPTAPSGPSTLEEWVAAAPTVEVAQQPQPVNEPSASVSNVPTTQQIPGTFGSSANSIINNGPESRQTSSAPSETSKLPPIPQIPPVHPVTTTDPPPYHPPSTVQYPKDSIPNRFFHSMSPKPKLSGVTPHSLYRPQYFPPDLDSRIDPHSIWMGVDKNTLQAKYVVPASCVQCAASQAQYCDRGIPSCGPCRRLGIACSPGTAWRYLKTVKRKDSPSVNDNESGRNDSPGSSASFVTSNVAVKVEDPRGSVERGSAGPVKRVQKKRRMEDSIDTLSQPGPSSTKSLPANANARIAHTDPDQAASRRNLKKPRVSLPIESPAQDPPLSADDREYRLRLDANAKKPPLRDMRSKCPVWAETRRALCSAAEYLRNPVRTLGASVEVGQGDIARGIILEGQAPADGDYWGMGERAGSIVASIGHPRPRRNRGDAWVDPSPSVEAPETIVGPESPPVDVRTRGEDHEGETSAARSVTPKIQEVKQQFDAPRTRESYEIEALCSAQRLRSPLAIAVAEDYSGTPFKVPREFIVLGWFWVVDAWVEPASDNRATSKQLTTAVGAPQVQWKFRFEWCEPQPPPWWSSRQEPAHIPTPSLRLPYTVPLQPFQQLKSDRRTVGGKDLGEHEPDVFCCPECKMRSKRIYDDGFDMCLNEACQYFFHRFVSTANGGAEALEGGNGMARSKKLKEVVAVERLMPGSLGLKLRPDIPAGEGKEGRDYAGGEWWRAWVCDVCGMANERRKWEEWDCIACGQTVRLQRKVFDAFYLRDPSRPVCTGPRQDDGMPNWPFVTTMGWTLFHDDIKVIKHGVDFQDGLGRGTDLFHALNTEGKMSHVSAGMLLRGFQIQGAGEIPLRRQVQPHTTNRYSERYLSPFYTMLLGDSAPALSHFPAASAVPWNKAPKTCLDAADLVNERAGRMWPGTREFNSLLVAAFPPKLPPGLVPRILVEPNTYFAFLFLGSDGEIRFRRHGMSGKTGDLKYQHGDVIGIKAGEFPIEVAIKPDGFGFVCIARRMFKANTLDIVDKDAEFPALPHPTRSTLPKATPRGSAGKSNALAGTATGGFGSSAAMSAASPSAGIAGGTKGKAKEKLLEKASLNGWYLGPRPLNPEEPLRLRPSSDDKQPLQPASTNAASEHWKGVITITFEEIASVKTVSPVMPPPAKKPDNVVATPPAKAKRGRKSKGDTTQEIVEVADDQGDLAMDVDPPSAPNVKKKPAGRGRKSGGGKATGSAGAEVKSEDVVMDDAASTATAGSGSRGGGGRGGRRRRRMGEMVASEPVG